MDREENIKIVVGNYRIPITLIYKGKRIYIRAPYNKKLIAEIRDFEGAKWHGYDENPVKMWSIADSMRNQFQLKFLMGDNPYAEYDQPLKEIKSNRPLYKHQYEAASFAYTRHYCIFAMEMGTGKTLAAIEVMESIPDLHNEEAWYIGPKSGVYAVGRELVKWNSRIKPKMLTYEALVRELRNTSGEPDFAVPKVVIFDESSKIKNPTAQRSEAALYLANAVRETHGREGFVILMSGTPAPKNPTDWWHQAECACPGFLKEGNVHKFKARMCLIEERQSITGGVYPHIVTWLDDETKCKVCGQFQDHPNHCPMIATITTAAEAVEEARELIRNGKTPFEDDVILDKISKGIVAQDSGAVTNDNYHPFVKSVNEVQYLYERLHGLAIVKFKKNCLDLPEKQYKIIHVKPTAETLRAAKLIKATSPRAITALTLLRELSDGFQYQETKTGDIECTLCHGVGTITAPILDSGVDVTMAPQKDLLNPNLENGTVVCDLCGGAKTIPQYARTTEQATSPKDEVFIDLLDEHEDVGRMIVFGGFMGTIDRLTEMSKQQGWAVLQIDGRGFSAMNADGSIQEVNDFLDAMDLSNPRYKEMMEKYPRIVVVANAQAGGYALTLTASPTELFYSNGFNGEARFQAEDRFHRAGTDCNRAATIIDLIHLPSDQLILDNLKKKRKLQDVSMGELEEAFKDISVEFKK